MSKLMMGLTLVAIGIAFACSGGGTTGTREHIVDGTCSTPDSVQVRAQDHTTWYCQYADGTLHWVR